MASFNRLLLAVAMLLVFGTQLGQCLRVAFYRENNYNGFVEDVVRSGDEEKGCINLKYGGNVIRSVKSDKCIIMYASGDCASSATPPGNDLTYILSSRIDSDTPKLTTVSGSQLVNSFHVCSQERGGGPQMDFDVYQVSLIGGTLVYQKDEYRGECGCRNLPSWVSEKPSGMLSLFKPTINNYGNSVNLYSGEECRGQSKYVPAGQGPDSWTLNSLSFGVKSFKPAELKHCYRLDAKITKFEFRNGTTSIEDLPTDTVQLSTDTVIKNNGSSEVTQTYKVTSTTTETVEFSVAESFTSTHSTGVEASVEMKFEAGIPLIAKTEVTTKIAVNYQWTGSSSSETVNKTVISNEESIEVEQQIKVPPCSSCVASSFLKRVKDFRLDYTAHAKLTAAQGFPSVPANVLRENLPAGMKYVRDLDQYSVEATTESSMFAMFGLKALINVDCDPNPIPGCRIPSIYIPPADYHQRYEVPIHVIQPKRYGSTSRRATIFPFLENTLALLMKHFA